MLDYFLRDFQWYRRWKGGTWRRIVVRPFPYINFWTQCEPNMAEVVVDTERWEDGNASTRKKPARV